MKQLSDECERFIVQALACFIPPEEVAKAVWLQFMVELPVEQVRIYDPASCPRPGHLSPDLECLFRATRDYYLAGLSSLAVEVAAGRATKEFRLALLQQAFNRLMEAEDPWAHAWLMMAILEEGAKESGGWYEGYSDPSLRDTMLIRLVTLTRSREEILASTEDDVRHPLRGH